MKGFKHKISKFIKIVFSISLLFMTCDLTADVVSKLPKTTILGQEYYIYEVKKGESIYGIAKKNGWDLEELLRLNPSAKGSIGKGDRLYYPTGKIEIVTETPEPIDIENLSIEPIKHKVKKGETIYSISKQYNIPLEILYKYNPNSKKGVKAGEIIEIPQTGKSEFYYYTIKMGDSLSSISQKFNTSLEDLLKNNAGLTTKNLHPGEIIRISINSNVNNVKTELVAEERVSQISGYKVAKNESWNDISEKTGVAVDILKEANQENLPKENSVVNIPLIETVEVEKIVNNNDFQNISEANIEVIYDSIKGVTPEEKIIQGVRMALIMDEPNSKKDIDFTRGLLIGLDKFKDSSYKIDLKVLDGRVSTADLIEQLDLYEPNLIISTADKAFPLFLADYGNTSNIQIVNVFDLKNDLYEDNPSIVQVLPPSRFYYDRLSSKLYKDNKNRKLIAVGEEDENDIMANELFKLYDGGEKMTLEDFGSLEPDIFQPILIYSYASKKEEIGDFFKNVENLSENNPGVDFKIVGKSSWIALIDEFGDQYNEYSVIIPSRVGLDEESDEWKKFEEEYDQMFEGYPVRSIPNFAASGYDIANFFIPFVASNHGDFNQGRKNSGIKALQNEIDLSRVSNWGGFINGTCYLLRFRPGGERDKITVK